MEQERVRVKHWRYWSVYKRCYLVLLFLEMLTYDKALAAPSQGNLSATVVDFTSVIVDVLILAVPLAFLIWGVERTTVDFCVSKGFFRRRLCTTAETLESQTVIINRS